jgi:hypothetical protein
MLCSSLVSSAKAIGSSCETDRCRSRALSKVVLDVGVGDGAAIGVSVDQQDLAARGGRLEGEVDGHGGAAGSALGPPDGG